MNLLPFLTGVVGGLLGGGLGFAANYARHRWDLHTKRIEAFCAELERTSDRASAYWLEPLTSYEVKDGLRIGGGTGERLSVEKEKAASAANLTESQILGAQSKLATTGALIRSKLDNDAHFGYDKLIWEYFEQLSGGEFSSRSGQIDIARAGAIQGLSAALIAHVRLASESYFTLQEASGLGAVTRRGRAKWHDPQVVAARHTVAAHFKKWSANLQKRLPKIRRS